MTHCHNLLSEKVMCAHYVINRTLCQSMKRIQRKDSTLSAASSPALRYVPFSDSTAENVFRSMPALKVPIYRKTKFTTKHAAITHRTGFTSRARPVQSLMST